MATRIDTATSTRRFKGMLARVFSDATVDEGEAAEIRAFLASGELATEEVTEVILDFVQTTWRVTVADSHISEKERSRMREIVRVLEVPHSSLPPAWVEAIRGSPADRDSLPWRPWPSMPSRPCASSCSARARPETPS